VLVTIQYEIAQKQHEEFVQLMQRVERIRRRTGSYSWGLYQDPSDPDRFVETFLSRTWAEHMRQHTRATMTDRNTEEQALALLKPGTSTVTSHFIAAHAMAFDGKRATAARSVPKQPEAEKLVGK
jgi:quinol monooxygenase YgiN